jgi:hypothetical protein
VCVGWLANDLLLSSTSRHRLIGNIIKDSMSICVEQSGNERWQIVEFGEMGGRQKEEDKEFVWIRSNGCKLNKIDKPKKVQN